MKLNVKHLSGKHFEIEAKETDTVATLKQLIETKEGATVAAAGNQKLIHSGKILQDETVVSEAGIKESDFIVLMITKPKQTPAKPASSAVPEKIKSGHDAAGAPAAAPVVSAAPSNDPTPTPDTALSSGAPSGGASGGILIGAELQSAIQNLVDMGFARDEVVRAMKASFNNPERAVQYLTEGNIPSNEPSGPPPAAASASTSGNAAAEASAGLGNAAAALQNNPQMAQLLQMMQQDPASMAQLIQQLQQTNPQLLEMISQDPAGVLGMLGGGDGGAMGEGGDEEDGVHVSLTQDELSAVQRVHSLSCF